MNIKSILNGLDRLPEEILINNIKPHLDPKSLVWLNKDNYITRHKCIYSMIGNQRTLTFPGGKFDSFVRYIIREEATFVLNQILVEKIKIWYSSSIYKYANHKYKNYLFFIYQYSIDNNFTKSKTCINNIAKSILGKKWHKN